MTEETKNVDMEETVETAEDAVAEDTAETVDAAENVETAESDESEEVAEDAAEDAATAGTTEEAEETTETGEGSDEGSTKKKEGFFKKKKDKKDEQIEELTDRVKRQMAEFDNFRKRSEKEKSQMFDLGAKNVIEKILPIIDNFERGFTMVEEADKEDAFVVGMDKIYKQLLSELEAIGVKPIECIGQEFNPDFHNAVMQVESEEYESGIVAQELLKGYTYKDTVVRHSMVAVVQ